MVNTTATNNGLPPERQTGKGGKGESAWQTQDGVAEILAAGRSLLLLLLLLDREPIQLIGGQLPSE